MKSSYIKIGNRAYSVACLNDEDFDSLLACKRVYEDGVKSFVDYDDQLIVVRDRLREDHKRELVLHEILHACIEDSGTEQSNSSETFISLLAPRLSGIISFLPHVINEVVC